jgi:hypothetical protein
MIKVSGNIVKTLDKDQLDNTLRVVCVDSALDGCEDDRIEVNVGGYAKVVIRTSEEVGFLIDVYHNEDLYEDHTYWKDDFIPDEEEDEDES